MKRSSGLDASWEGRLVLERIAISDEEEGDL